jgi:hypothetical protein
MQIRLGTYTIEVSSIFVKRAAKFCTHLNAGDSRVTMCGIYGNFVFTIE